MSLINDPAEQALERWHHEANCLSILNYRMSLAVRAGERASIVMLTARIEVARARHEAAKAAYYEFVHAEKRAEREKVDAEYAGLRARLASGNPLK